eukprot:m.1256802 g.1256802  ORF g.1256802 m.1256802 type:complete len:359 (+) comp24712_c0_seq28:2701-3777(+)
MDGRTAVVVGAVCIILRSHTLTTHVFLEFFGQYTAHKRVWTGLHTAPYIKYHGLLHHVQVAMLSVCAEHARYCGVCAGENVATFNGVCSLLSLRLLYPASYDATSDAAWSLVSGNTVLAAVEGVADAPDAVVEPEVCADDADAASPPASFIMNSTISSANERALAFPGVSGAMVGPEMSCEKNPRRGRMPTVYLSASLSCRIFASGSSACAFFSPVCSQKVTNILRMSSISTFVGAELNASASFPCASPSSRCKRATSFSSDLQIPLAKLRSLSSSATAFTCDSNTCRCCSASASVRSFPASSLRRPSSCFVSPAVASSTMASRSACKSCTASSRFARPSAARWYLAVVLSKAAWALS